MHELIQSAAESIVLQMYLFAGNDELGTLRPVPGAFGWARLLVDWLVERRRNRPDLDIVVILDTQTPDDPALTFKGKRPLSRHLLEEAGIPVLNANLFGTRFNEHRRFPPITDFHRRPPSATPAAQWVRRQQRWQTYHNVEDHRKNLVIDQGAWGAVMSHNTIDIAARWHENLFLIGAPAAGDLWKETAHALSRALELSQRVNAQTREDLKRLAARPARMQSRELPPAVCPPILSRLGDPGAAPRPRAVHIKIVSNTAIRGEIIRALSELRDGDRVAVATTYFSDMEMLEVLRALGPGISVRVLIDDCAGLPLNFFLSWVVRTFANLRCIVRVRRASAPGFELRVHSSRGKPMMHLKTAGFSHAAKPGLLIGGQANYTPNSFSGAWLETDVMVEDESMLEEFLKQFDALWRDARVVSRVESRGRPVGALRGFARRMADGILLGILSILESLGFRP